MIELKKAVSTSIMILYLLFVSGLVGYKIPAKVSADLIDAQTSVIYVPANYSTIQDAINHANPGDEIFVSQEVYVENIVVNKSISLVGEDRDFTIINSNGTGSVITVETVNNVNITGFTIRGAISSPADSGISLEYCSGNVISHNNIIGNNAGISIHFFGGTLISDNIISSNTGIAGIYLYSSSSNTISGNTISSNYYNGISLDSSSSNTISGNIVSSNSYNGISLDSSSNNVVSGNTISNNFFYGIYLASSSYNTIYHNNFDNTNQAWIVSSQSVWSYDGEGNYWSDYTGPDFYSGPYQNETGSDGIGDTPYVKSGVLDSYPLMGMFSLFNIGLQTKAYDVFFISNSTVSKPVLEIGAETGDTIMLFNATGEEGTAGFCRIAVPTELMPYPYTVVIDSERIVPTTIGILNQEYAHLYFAYSNRNYTTRIISSEALHLYYDLLGNFTRLFDSYSELNMTYFELLYNYSIFLENYTQLQQNYIGLNASYQEHLLDYSEQVQNIRSLMYIFAATTAVFLITTIYLSSRAHAGTRVKTKVLVDEK